MEDKDYIVIPNPIYDVVFKYLMEDYESAKIILSTLTGEKIIKLNFVPLSHSEKVADTQSNRDIRLFHLDFTATIKLPSGEEELIMIELQKASVTSDIFRFKRYISKNFNHKHKKEITNAITNELETKDFPIRLIPIFILNFKIEDEIKDLVIKVKREKSGVFKDKTLTENNEFIDHLSYDMCVVQLPYLHNVKEDEYKNNPYKKELFTLLKLFDQQLLISDNKHRLRVFKAVFPEHFTRIINRLQAADKNNPDLEQQMSVEDEYLQELINRDNAIVFLKEQNEKRLEEIKLAKQKEQEARQEEYNVKRKLAIKMTKYNESIDEIIKETGLSKDEILKLNK